MIETLSPGATPREVSEVVQRDGVAIVRDLVPEALMQQLEEDVQPGLDQMEPGVGGPFYGGRAKLLSQVYEWSDAMGEMITDPLLTGVADILLRPHCNTYQIGVSAVIEVWDSGERMTLHRDADIYTPYFGPTPERPQTLLQFMWALTDFTAHNGATRFVVGSHKWPPERQATKSEVDVAVMPRGSVALWHGGTIHGFGINETDKPRRGVTSGFSLGWLRQEQNQYLSLSPERVEQLPHKVRSLLGWQPHSEVLGYQVGNDPDAFAGLEEQRRA